MVGPMATGFASRVDLGHPRLQALEKHRLAEHELVDNNPIF